MASQSQGIQQLLIAEKKAAEKVGEARKRKVRRIKQARDEAKADIEKYRNHREAIFKEFEAKHLGGKEEIGARIDKDTEILIQSMGNDVQVNKAKVIEELIAYVTDIQPEIHRNYFIMNPKPKSVKK